MSPRKTRRGAKGNGANETFSETISQKSDVNSPPPSQHSIKTRRRLTKTSSTNVEGDQSFEINKSKSIDVKEMSLAKTSRSRKNLVSATDIADNSSNPLNVSVRTRKHTRSIKENDDTYEPTLSVNSKTIDDVQAGQSRTRARKKIGKKGNAKSEEESINITSGEKNNAIVAKNSKIISNGHEDVGDPMSKEDKEVQEATIRILRIKAGSRSPLSPPRSVVKHRGRPSKLKIEDFTPESSPITVSLTPHRTTKTPRKSPMNLGSPKSHAEQPLRLTKTPRKLPVVEESSVAAETSSASSIKNTTKDLSNDQNGTEAKSPNTSSLKKKRTPKSSEKKSRKSPSKGSPVRRFSKSPKIVLRTPRAKSSKSKSPRVVTSKKTVSPVPKRLTKSPIKSRKSPITSRTSPIKSRQSLEKPTPKVIAERIVTSSSPKRAKRSESPEKSTVKSSLSEISRQMTLHLSRIDTPRSMSVRDTKCSSLGKQSDVMVDNRLPTIVLNPISPSRIMTPETPMRSSARTNNTNKTQVTPPKTSSAKKRGRQNGESPRRSKLSSKKLISINNSDTPLRPSSSPQRNSSMRSIGKSIIISSSNNTPADIGRQKLNKTPPMVSSTPHEKIRRALNLSPGLGATSTIIGTPTNVAHPVGSSTLIGEARVTRRSRIEDETNPLISDDDTLPLTSDYLLIDDKESSCLDETFELVDKKMLTVEDEEEKAVDGTYELIEPKTPVLRRKMGKRSIEQVDTNVEESATKRTCRVRFACSPAGVQENHSVVTGRSRSATPGQRIGPKRVTSGKISLAETNGSLRKRSNSMTNVSPMKTPIFDMKRRSKSVSDGNAISAIKTAQNASVNRLSKPRSSISSAKKPETKTPTAKKAPNFALIHERKFAKMESLVDAKKRVEKRHLTISSQIPTGLSRVNNNTRSKMSISPKPAASNVPVNGVYNRFGFKLRKREAVTMMSQKQPARASEKKQNDNRKILKGVRTNRRFELIMKARNINH